MPTSEIRREAHPAFIAEVWLEVRPYAICLSKDFLIAVMLWGLLWLFKQLTKAAPIDGWTGEFLVNLHAAGTVTALSIFIGLLLWDVIEIHKRGK